MRYVAAAPAEEDKSQLEAEMEPEPITMPLPEVVPPPPVVKATQVDGLTVLLLFGGLFVVVPIIWMTVSTTQQIRATSNTVAALDGSTTQTKLFLLAGALGGLYIMKGMSKK